MCARVADFGFARPGCGSEECVRTRCANFDSWPRREELLMIITIEPVGIVTGIVSHDSKRDAPTFDPCIDDSWVAIFPMDREAARSICRGPECSCLISVGHSSRHFVASAGGAYCQRESIQRRRCNVGIGLRLSNSNLTWESRASSPNSTSWWAIGDRLCTACTYSWQPLDSQFHYFTIP